MLCYVYSCWVTVLFVYRKISLMRVGTVFANKYTVLRCTVNPWYSTRLVTLTLHLQKLVNWNFLCNFKGNPLVKPCPYWLPSANVSCDTKVLLSIMIKSCMAPCHFVSIDYTDNFLQNSVVQTFYTKNSVCTNKTNTGKKPQWVREGTLLLLGDSGANGDVPNPGSYSKITCF